jgi:hypothetical protein
MLAAAAAPRREGARLRPTRRPRRPARALAVLAALAAAPALAQTVPQTAPLPRPAAVAGAAGPEVDPEVEAALFAMPEIADATRRALALIEAGETAAAASIFDALIARHPGLGRLRADRAAIAMLAGDPELALAELEAAAARGFPGLAEVAADPIFAPLAGDPGLAALAALPPPAAPPAPVPAPVVAGAAQVGADNTAWNPETERLEPRFAFPDAPDAAVLPPGPKAAARDLVREHVRRGRAAGNHGDLYDNRDRGHSTLDPADHPQLAHVAYAAAARAADLDYGLNDRLLFDRPTFGNSSTAITAGPHWRSLPRHALTRPDGAGPMRLWQTAAANHVYVHPAHRDYGGARGDLFPANTPYLVVTRGSSGSGRPALEALALTFAAFRPDTKAKMIEAGMLNSTVQMVFRRSLQPVTSRELYFSGAAHPAAFEGWQVNPARMVSLANSIAADAIPAEARIRVLEEDLGTEGVDFFGRGLSEQLFDTPQAVARIWRGTAGRRSMILSAEDSRDANGRPLTFTWALLQGDPEKVAIEPLDDGRRARVTLDWHEPFRISEANDQVATRVDIGVFANNGVHDSAPAILSWAFPAHETRAYEPGPDGAPRIAAVDYADPARAETYADPLIYPRAGWRDVHHYAADGRPLGWIRTTADGREAAYAADGARVLEAAADGTPLQTAAVAYTLRPGPGGALDVAETSAGVGGLVE